MKTILVLALFLSGCAGMGYDADDDESRVHRAAMTWVGANVEEMVQAWGEPNNLRIDATENNQGLVRWRDTRRLAGTNTSAGTSSYTCIVEAYFGMDGTINRVETMTNNCDALYTEEQLARFTR